MKVYQATIVAFISLLIVGCSGAATVSSVVSPTDTLKNFIEASKKKDVAAIKKTLSKGSLELAEESAKKQNITVDELFSRDNTAMPGEIPEIRNERIEGDAASVEVKDLTDGYDTIPFVKEEGAWKIAFDKYQQTMMEKMRQEMKMPASNLSKPDGDKQLDSTTNKSEADK
jgi:outer membrane biogenesis lipoprotein LolB